MTGTYEVRVTPLVAGGSQPVRTATVELKPIPGDPYQQEFSLSFTNGNGALVSSYAVQKLVEGATIIIKTGAYLQIQLEKFARYKASQRAERASEQAVASA